MRIVDPEPILSRSERRLLVLLDRLIEWKCKSDTGSGNQCRSVLPITDRELSELEGALEEYVESQEFLKKSYFVENIFSQNGAHDGGLRDIYLSERAKRGRKSRIMSSRTWEHFKARLGANGQNLRYYNTPRMSFDHFIKMEALLFLKCGISNDVAEHLLNIVRDGREELENLRSGNRKGRVPSIKKIIFAPMINALSKIKNTPDREISMPKISAILIIVCDFGVLFTTRDWGVAGACSAIASALPQAINNQ